MTKRALPLRPNRTSQASDEHSIHPLHYPHALYLVLSRIFLSLSDNISHFRRSFLAVGIHWLPGSMTLIPFD